MILVLAAAAFILALDVFAYQTLSRDALRATESRLSKVAEAQVSAISRWRTERYGNATVIAADLAFGRLVQQYLAKPDIQKTQDIHSILAAFIQGYGYGAAALFAPDGTPAVIDTADGKELPSDLAGLIPRAVAEGKPIFSDLHIHEYGEGFGQVEIEIAVPVFADGAVVGVVGLLVEPENYLYPLLRDWPLLEPGMEIVLTQRHGDNIDIVNPLARRTGGPLIFHRSTSEPDLPSARAARGERGVMTATDYRGVKVLAALRDIPDSNWLLIAKVDLSEVNAGLRRIAAIVAAAGVLVAAVAFAAVCVKLGRMRADRLAAELKARADQADLLERTNQMASRLGAVLDNTPIGLAIVTLGRLILQTNHAFGQIFGLSAEALLGQTAEVLYGSKDAFDDVGRRAYPAFRRGETFDEVVPLRTIDSREILVRLTARLIDPKVPELGVVWAAADVTEQIHYDEELTQARDTLQRQAADLARSNAELEQFAYVASHDLRAPLRSVISYLSLISMELGEDLSADLKEFLGYAVGGAKRMDALIVGLLEYARAGRKDSKPKPVPLSEAIAESLTNLVVPIGDAEATVTVAEGLPAIMGDWSEIVRLFQNLIGNAVKYRAAGCPPVIALTWRTDGGSVVIAIQDNGIGIPPDQGERIFGVFQRLHGIGEYEGTGIGLSVCRKIVEHHHGRIWVEPVEGGQGSTFLVAFPRSA